MDLIWLLILNRHLSLSGAVRFEYKHIHKKDMSLEETGPCACNLLTVLGSLVIVNRGCGAGVLYDHFIRNKIFT